MPAYVVALYGQPTDPDAFGTYYLEQHAPLVRKVPGLETFQVSAGPAVAPDGTPVFHRIAMLRFASMDDLQSALAAPEGQAIAADLANFASGGVTLAMFEAQDVTSP